MQRDPEAFEQFLSSLRSYVRERLVPNEVRVAEADEVPADLVADMAAQGLFGYSIAQQGIGCRCGGAEIPRTGEGRRLASRSLALRAQRPGTGLAAGRVGQSDRRIRRSG